MPAFDYDSLLLGERQIRSVANMTRADALDFPDIAERLSIRPRAIIIKLEMANEALVLLTQELDASSIVLVP